LISASKDAVHETAGGTVSNNVNSTIEGFRYGVYIGGAGTVTNAGTIGSTYPDAAANAVVFASLDPSNLLIVDPGAVFTGNIVGGAGTVELASAASAGTLSGFDGTSITNFGSLVFDPGAQWSISGTKVGLEGLPIIGFDSNDTIDPKSGS
jgi:hypothetical protein